MRLDSLQWRELKSFNIYKQDKILRTIEFLERNLEDIKSSAYALSIVTYALHTSGSDRAEEAMDALEILATYAGRYWGYI